MVRVVEYVEWYFVLPRVCLDMISSAKHLAKMVR